MTCDSVEIEYRGGEVERFAGPVEIRVSHVCTDADHRILLASITEKNGDVTYRDFATVREISGGK